MDRSIALVMMVKNEAPALATTIRSAVETLGPVLGAIVIVDTGSTDGTQDVIDECKARAWFPDVPAGVSPEAMPDPFRFDMGRNRTLEIAESWLGCLGPSWDVDAVRWLFMLDAGTVVRGDFQRQCLSDPCGFRVTCRLGALQYQRPQVFGRGRGWLYVGARHEFAQAPADGSVPLCGLIVSYELKDPARPARWESDLDALRPDAEKGEPRAMFYYAQTLHCLGRNVDAAEWYERRYENAAGFWQERYVSALRCAELGAISFGEDWDQRAVALDRRRAEAFVQRCYARRKDARPDWVANLHDAEKALTLMAPADALFTDLASYGWKAYDELAMAAFHLGQCDRAAEAWERSMAQSDPACPMADRERMRGNLSAALSRGVRGRE